MTTAKRMAALDDEFGSGGLTFAIEGPVNLAQLDAEIVEAMNWRVPAALVATNGRFDDEGFFGPIPEDEERSEDAEDTVATITVTHADPDARVISRVIKDHEPDAAWQGAVPDLAVLARKAQDGPLSEKETQQALALLLLPYA